MCEEIGVLDAGDLVYLYLPLAHSFALLIQLLRDRPRRPIAYWGGDPKQIVPELMAVKPTYLPSVPRIFEKIYTLVTSSGDPEKIRGATQLGLKVRALQEAGEPVPSELQAAFDKADAELFTNVRNVFGGRLKQADHRRGPDRDGDPRVLLRLRRAGDGGLRHDRDLDGGDDPDGRAPPPRHRRARAARLRDPDRRGRRGARPRPADLPRLLQDGDTPRSARSRTAGCTPATSARSTTTASSPSPGARRTSSSRPAART